MRELINSFVELPQMMCDCLLRDEDFRKLVCHDVPDALALTNPSDERMSSLVAKPDEFNTQGCRIFLQELLPTITDSKTIIQIWTSGMAEQIPQVMQGIRLKVRVMNHLALETMFNGSKTVSRSLAIVQRVYSVLCDRLPEPHIEADTFIAGIGPLHMTSVERISDNRERCGYEVTLETCW